ncbi:UDP-2,3-diacylglucosamine diphosphatase [Bacteroides sedimenti]|uniref:UDP-2,3-diacylglucosamine hydrolase n=1 Tax=Bacteroides sedimenti TaxID=2136147 RepID=A0ABM8IG73_9BACE
MQLRTYYPTVVLSDIHLGTAHSKTEEVSSFLKSINCDKLILNGDIIDGWQLQKGGLNKWKAKHTQFFKVIMKMMENFGTEVIYVRGNHDDFLDNLAPLTLYNLKIVKDYTHESHGKRYYVTHGDVFDSVTTQMKWLAKLGDVGYSFLLWLNKIYNARRVKKGKPYYSLSQSVKQKVKSAVSYISDFEKELVELARIKRCNGIICGHIHHPENRFYEEIHYLNSGDWVETLSALVEDEKGNWSVRYYEGMLMEANREEVIDEICIAS